MKSLSSWLIVVALAAIAAAEGTQNSPAGATPGRSIAAGTLLRGHVLNVRSPDSPGWVFLKSTAGQIAFARKGKAPGSGYMAQVLVFPGPESKSQEGFVAFVREAISKDTDPERFEVRKSDFRRTEERKYTCVRVEYLADDKKAHISASKTERLGIDSISLYCRHPLREHLAFAVIYSHRGKSPDPKLRKGADDFIEHVQVPAD